MYILSIDPGLEKLGFCIFNFEKCRPETYGLISTSCYENKFERISKIKKELLKLFNRYNPKFVAVEKIFFNKNIKTAIQIGEIIGIILSICVDKKIKFFEFTPQQVKVALTGYGKAEKIQVQRMVKQLLDLKKIPEPDDVADAIAIGYCLIVNLKARKLI